MSMLGWWRPLSLGVFGVAGLVLVGLVGNPPYITGAEEPKPLPVNPKSQELGGEDRYLTYVDTDKPMYRPGEKLHARAVVLHYATRKPWTESNPQGTLVEVLGPKGDTVASGYVKAEDGVAGYSWEIPAATPGGSYKMRVTHPWAGDAPTERTFDIRAYRAPRLKTQIKFVRDGYGPGDEATANLSVDRAEGGIPAGAKVTVVARVDGEEVGRSETQVDAQGKCIGKCKLPAQIRRGEGTMSFIVEDGGVVETASKTIPILLQTVDLTMYPEGGELVAGLPNRVYFEAFTPAKKPADLTGEVLDGAGQVVAKFRSEHEGRGRFDFTPKAGEKYSLKVTEPASVTARIPLPEVKAEGTVIHSDKDTFAAKEPIAVQVGVAPKGAVKVVISQREKVLATINPETKDGALAEAKAELPADVAGILVATVFDAQDKPLAERLLFRQPEKQIKIKIAADQPRYTPGGKAVVTVTTTDESDKPVSAVVGISVTDDSVLEMVEKREQIGRLPVMVFLENDVKELADAHVYLDPDNKDAPKAVDLLLGTQGWRRFAFVDVPKFVAAHGDQARRALAMKVVTRREIEELANKEGAGGGVRLFAAAAAPPRPAAAPGAPVPLPAPAPPAGGEPVPEAAAPEAAPAAAVEAAAKPAPLAEAKQVAREANGIAAGRHAGDFAERNIAPGPRGPVADGKLEQALEKAEEAQADRADFLGRRKRMAFDPSTAIRNDFIAVRVYAHEVRKDRQPNDRRDFAETLFWHAGLKTNEKSGEAKFEFGLNDSVTSFRIAADAFNSSGSLGAKTQKIESVQPLYTEPKLPLEVTSGDWVRVPIGIVNATPGELKGLILQVEAKSPLASDMQKSVFDLGPGGRARTLHGVKIGGITGNVDLTYSVQGGPYQDKVTHQIVVKPLGFPIQWTKGGLLPSGGTATHEISVPDNFVQGSIRTRLAVYPTPLASMTSALEALIQEPCGCFEQTSSTTYPLVMAQQYFKSHQGVDQAIIDRAERTLETGYNRLIGFECKGGGYEWFGSDPGHDALTAYGLMEFTDMSQVRDVDSAMLQRTKKWLLEQRDGKGGYLRKTHTLHTWLPEPEVCYAYDTWALIEAGMKDELANEVAWVAKNGEVSLNTYVTALSANVLWHGGDKDTANRLLDKLAGKQEADGSVGGATVSVVGSSGEALKIETTALAMLAWLPHKSFVENVEKARNYLAEVCKNGRFGSTQSSILALKAIVAYDRARAKPKAPGKLQLVIDDQPVGDAVSFTVDTQGAILLPDFAGKLSAGKHKVQVKMEGGSEMPYSFAVDYNSLQPETSADCKIHLETTLRDAKVDEGSVTEVNVVIINRKNEIVPNPVAIVGIPGGLEVRHDQLKELVKAQKIAAYEVIGREVVLYWRSLEVEQRVELPISLTAAVPGKYTGPASRGYLYYTNEHKHWTPSLAVEITPRGE